MKNPRRAGNLRMKSSNAAGAFMPYLRYAASMLSW